MAACRCCAPTTPPAPFAAAGKSRRCGRLSGERCGSGIASVRVGDGRAWIYGLRPLPDRGHAASRHGRRARTSGEGHGAAYRAAGISMDSSSFPRSCHGDVPVCDLHQDILEDACSVLALRYAVFLDYGTFHDAAPALWFVKGDGCGEIGADVEVQVVEEYGAYLTFNRPPVSRFGGRPDEGLARAGARHHHRSQPGRRHAAPSSRSRDRRSGDHARLRT